MNGDLQRNPECAFTSILSSSVACTCITELMLTPGVELITFVFEHYRVIHSTTEST